MVDALREASRVVIPGGLILDLRPMSGNYPLEFFIQDAVIPAGEVSGFGGADSDRVCDIAVDHALQSGWFTRGGSSRFDFEMHFDTAEELRAEVESRRRTKATRLDYAALESRRCELSARIRFRRPSMLDVYLKP